MRHMRASGGSSAPGAFFGGEKTFRVYLPLEPRLKGEACSGRRLAVVVAGVKGIGSDTGTQGTK
jgi:hypothetical protein